MRDEVGKLHNLLVELIIAFSLTPAEVLYVLELLKSEIMENEMKDKFKQKSKIKLSDIEPTKLT